MKESTLNRIIETAESLIIKNGFNFTGISQILKQANVPKGSFYHYFESKEALGYAIINKAFDNQMTGIDSFFHNAKGTPLEKIKKFFQRTIENYDLEAVHSCIIGNLGQELAEQHEGYRKKLNQIYTATEKYFENLLLQARKISEIKNDVDCSKMASFLFSSWEGAILSSKIKKTKQPLIDCVDIFLKIVEKK